MSAVANLSARFVVIDEAHVEATVRRCVGESLAEARVTTFVGIIAERRARLELQKKPPNS